MAKVSATLRIRSIEKEDLEAIVDLIRGFDAKVAVELFTASSK